MKFFCDIEVNYPDDAENLRTTVITDSTTGPQKKPMHFFNAYFKSGGTAQHPLLGNLNILADEIDALWDDNYCGLNLVSSLIRHKLENLTPAVESDLSNSPRSL